MFGVSVAEGKARFDVGHELTSDYFSPLLGILFLRTYAFYHGNKKILAFLVLFYVVCPLLLPHCILFNTRVILGRVRYCHRYCEQFRALPAMYVIRLSALPFNASFSL
jgi:hypothetical protein